MRQSISFVVAFCVTLAAAFLTQPAAADDGKITIGSKAPDLDIEHWVSDGDGQFAHVTKLERGKVYVIEFWATWCGPCVASMPEISKLQDDMAGAGVQVISVSDESLDEVEAFLERDVRGKAGVTYGELTNNYCLTVDPDGSVFEDYFHAAGRTGIPCAFVVGKTGLIEWIGHPAEMRAVLEEVVEGGWDRKAFLVKYEQERAAAEQRQLVQRKLMAAVRKIEGQMEEGNFPRAVEMIEKLMEDEDLESLVPNLKAMKSEIMILHVGGDEGATALKQFIKDNGDDPEALNTIAWAVYEKHSEDGKMDAAILQLALESAEQAARAVPNNGAVLDTLAHLLYVNGKLDRALEVQQRALKNANGMEAELKAFLNELKAAKAKQQKSGK